MKKFSRPHSHATLCPSKKSSPAGFSIVELIVVLCVILLFLALLIPYMQRARERAREVTCQNNLRKIGIALVQFAEEDPQQRLCTGASDYLHDGCPKEYGWIADLYKLKGLSGATLHCPSHAYKHHSTLLDLFEVNGDLDTSNLPQELAYRFGGDCLHFPLVKKGDSSVDQGKTDAESNDRRQLVTDLIRRGLTTNYAPSWYLTRSGVKFEKTDDGLFQTSLNWNISQVGATLGPLSLNTLNSTPVATQKHPIAR